MVRKLKLLNADYGFKVDASVEMADPALSSNKMLAHTF